MEFKMFGPAGYPSSDFQKDLKVLLYLDDKAWDVLARWFETTEDFDADSADSSPAIAASPLLPEQFIDGANALKYILESWRMYDLQLAEIQRDLLLLNCPRERIEQLGPLLERLRPLRERMYAEYMRFDHENAVLPTLEDIRAVCDLRPIFEDTVYPIQQAAALAIRGSWDTVTWSLWNWWPRISRERSTCSLSRSHRRLWPTCGPHLAALPNNSIY